MKQSTLKSIHIRKPYQTTALDSFMEEQIILALRQQESREKTVGKISRELGISLATFFKNGNRNTVA